MTGTRPRTRHIKVFVREDIMRQIEPILGAEGLTLSAYLNSALANSLTNKEAICNDARSYLHAVELLHKPR